MPKTCAHCGTWTTDDTATICDACEATFYPDRRTNRIRRLPFRWSLVVQDEARTYRTLKGAESWLLQNGNQWPNEEIFLFASNPRWGEDWEPVLVGKYRNGEWTYRNKDFPELSDGWTMLARYNDEGH